MVETAQPEVEVQRVEVNLSTLGGISAARTDLYNRLMNGQVEASNARIADLILRGQTYLEGDLRLRYLKLLMDFQRKGSKGGEPVSAAIAGLDKFLQLTDSQTAGE